MKQKITKEDIESFLNDIIIKQPKDREYKIWITEEGLKNFNKTLKEEFNKQYDETKNNN